MVDEDYTGKNLIYREDTILVIIDVQEKLLPQIAHKESMVDNIIKLIKFAKIIDIPVVVTEQEKLGDTVPEIMHELSGQEAQAIKKVFYSTFSCDEFVKRIKELGRKTLIVTGMETHICVMQTALQAMPDYAVHIISDAVSSRFVNNWSLGLDRMRDAGTVISSTEMVIFELLRRAATDEFRATLPLVR